jgi:hypothetical protein
MSRFFTPMLLLPPLAMILLSLSAAGQSPPAVPAEKPLPQTSQTNPAPEGSAGQPAPQERMPANKAPSGAPTDGTKEPSAGKKQSGTGAKAATKGAAGGKTDPRQKNLEDCLAAYDPATNMTRREWAATCRRTLKEYPEVR